MRAGGDSGGALGSSRPIGRWPSRFTAQLGLRLAILLGTLTVLTYLVVATQLRAVTTVVAAVTLVEAWLILRLTHRANRELSRFLGAIRYDDYQQTFALGRLGESFAELEGAFEEVLGRFRQARVETEAQRRTLEALVEHVPVAILAVHEDGVVELENNAARQLLDLVGPTSVDALVKFGAGFQRDVARTRAGDRRLTRIEVDGVSRQLVLSTTEIVVTGRPLRVLTLQDIQRELDWNELSAWQDMARVLSHEIMNSLTPISSLARTADELVDDLAARADWSGERDETHADLHAAIGTLARRSEGLMRFIESYRELTHLPPPTRQPAALHSILARLERLMRDQARARGVELRVTPPPAGLEIQADESLLDQALINLVKNAIDAAAGAAEGPCVWIEARLSERGRPVIEIADNGPGIDAELAEKIFLPFFSTKPDGSGIGLALARQVMLVHHGAITAAARPGGGALFRLTF